MANNSQVAHRWANAHGEGHLRGSHFSYEGSLLYSYWTVIGRIVRDDQGQEVALLTEDNHSVTTARHLSEARRALDYGNLIPMFVVPECVIGNWLLDSYREMAAQHFVANAREAAERAKRSRKYTHRELETVEHCLREATEFCARFGLPASLVPTFESIVPPELQEKARTQQERNAEAERQAAIRYQERQARQREEDAANFLRWLNGAAGHCPSSYQTDEQGSAYMRVIDRNGVPTVQTSMGAEVPLSQAAKAFQFVKLCRMLGKAWHANGSQVYVGEFGLRSIQENGDTRVGCHFFTWGRIEEFAQRAGIFTLPGSDEALQVTRHH